MKKQSKKSFLFLLLIVPFILNAQVWEYKDSGTDFILLDVSIPPGQDQIAYAAGSQYTVDSEGIIIKTVRWRRNLGNHLSFIRYSAFIYKN